MESSLSFFQFCNFFFPSPSLIVRIKGGGKYEVHLCMGNSSYHSSAVVSFRALVGINSLSLSLCFSLEKDGKRKKRLENRKIGGNQFISGSLPVASVIVVFAGRLYYRSPTPLDRSKVRSESFRALIFPNWLVKQMGRKTKVGLTP